MALFTDRARSADARFALTSETTPMVAGLVARLDGMALAIELAAARVEALGLTQLLDRLDDRFALLAGGNRTAPSRQRSLAATVEWSYQLLEETERTVFRAVSVFPGPFTLEAVAGAGAGPAVLRLVDCSLVNPPRPGPDGWSRYSMLETPRLREPAARPGRRARPGGRRASRVRGGGWPSRPPRACRPAPPRRRRPRCGWTLRRPPCGRSWPGRWSTIRRPAEALTMWAASALLGPADLRLRDLPVRAARRALGADRTRAAKERGAAMSLAAAAEYALMLTDPGAQQPPPEVAKLSFRERELVTLVARGRTNAQIAAELYISVRTVGSHLDRIRDKTGCHRRIDLTRLALTTGLI